MKQKLYILGVLTAQIIFTGIVFKVCHWPGAGIILSSGFLVFVLGFLPFAFISLYRSEESTANRTLYIVSYITCFVIFTGMLFKIMHWPFAGLFLTIGLPFPYIVFLPVFLAVTAKSKNYSIYNIVAVLTLLAFFSVLSALLALNVSKEKLVDSYNLRADNNRVEKSIVTVTGSNDNTAVSSISEALGIIGSFKETIYGRLGVSVDQSEPDMELLKRSASTGAGYAIIEDKIQKDPGSVLSEAIVKVVKDLESKPDTRYLAQIVLAGSDINDPRWAQQLLGGNTLSWTLIELDAIETNLKMVLSAL